MIVHVGFSFSFQFNSGQDAFYYQLFVEKNDELKLPNVQQLFEQSFTTSNVKLREVPPVLIIQMPRFGKNYKMYPRIVPSQILDITDIVEGRKFHFKYSTLSTKCSAVQLQNSFFLS